MNYIVYKVINKLNKKEYIGVHKQQGVDFDGYLGSGILICRSVDNNGKENFYRVTLNSFSNKSDCYEYESYLVDEEYIKSNKTYNLTKGGYGGWYHCHNKEVLKKRMGTNSVRYGNPCGQMHTKESNNKRLNTNTLRYGNPNYYLHNDESRSKAEKSRAINMSSKGLNRNHYLNSRLAIDKAKVTRIKNTKLRSRNKYPELNKLVRLLDSNKNIIIEDILLEVSIYLFGSSKGTSCRNNLISVIEGKPFHYRSKWFNYTAEYITSSETIPTGSTLEV